MPKSGVLQNEINQLEQLIQGGGSDFEQTQRETELEQKKADLVNALAEELQQQAHEGRVQDATSEITTRLDTLYLGGQSLRELCADEEAYQILRISFTQDYISQATKNSEVLNQVQTDAQLAIKLANDRANESDEQNSTLLQENHRLTIELADIEKRFEVATNLLKEAPSSEETEKLKQTVTDLTAQLELKAKADEPKGDAKSQIDAMVQERENKKVKITNLRLADPSGINTKDYLATDVLTGEELKIHSNYVKSFKEVSAEEAEQIRTELQVTAITLQEPDISPVNPVLEAVAPAEVETFREEEIHSAEPGLVDKSLSLQGAEKDQVTLESLQAQVNAIKIHVGMAA